MDRGSRPGFKRLLDSLSRMLRRWISYFGSRFRDEPAQVGDPETEIWSAIDEARARDQELRNHAARVIASKIQLSSRIGKVAGGVGEAREMAKQALMEAEGTNAGGDRGAVDRWTRAARGVAVNLQASERDLVSLRSRYETTMTEAEQAKEAVQANAITVQDETSIKLEMLGAPERAKMQEAVDSGVQTMSTSIADESPDLDGIEQRIEQSMAEAAARTGFDGSTAGSAEDGSNDNIDTARVDARLDELRNELGLSL